jgi:hypothetical protein
MRFWKSSVLALLAPLVGCASLPRASDDVDVTEDVSEIVSLEGISQVVIRCYCPRRNVQQEPGHAELSIRAVGRLKSEGYHGQQVESEARESLRSHLGFDHRREGSTLFLVLSPDRGSYMHHSWGLGELWVSLPADRIVRIEPLPLLPDE